MYVETFKDFNVFKGWYHVQGWTITTWKCLLSLNYAFITVSITVHCGLWHPSSLIVIWYYLPWVSHFMIPKPFHLGISLPNHGGFYPGTDPRNRKEAHVNLQWGDRGLSEKQSPTGILFLTPSWWSCWRSHGPLKKWSHAGRCIPLGVGLRTYHTTWFPGDLLCFLDTVETWSLGSLLLVLAALFPLHDGL